MAFILTPKLVAIFTSSSFHGASCDGGHDVLRAFSSLHDASRDVCDDALSFRVPFLFPFFVVPMFRTSTNMLFIVRP
jgi:hypothetical protein